MNGSKMSLVRAIWVVCVSSTAAATAMVLYEAAHPLAEPGRRNLWLVYALPYFVIGVSAWVFRRRSSVLMVMLVVTGLTAICGTFARYADLQTALFVLDARAAGRIGMSCGPPPAMFAMGLEYGFALIAAAAAMRLLPSRPL